MSLQLRRKPAEVVGALGGGDKAESAVLQAGLKKRVSGRIQCSTAQALSLAEAKAVDVVQACTLQASNASKQRKPQCARRLLSLPRLGHFLHACKRGLPVHTQVGRGGPCLACQAICGDHACVGVELGGGQYRTLPYLQEELKQGCRWALATSFCDPSARPHVARGDGAFRMTWPRASGRDANTSGRLRPRALFP
eukprot:360016-Chlamydomonas_euryale.AAC.4